MELPPRRSLSRSILYAFLLILLLGGILRWYDLGKESFWTDEAFSVHHAQEEHVSEVITKVSETEAAPPLYYIILHYWVSWAGSSEVAVRFPSFLFGVLSIIIFFIIIRLFFEYRIALLSSLFMATSMLQVLFAQDARMYSLFTFLSLSTTYFFIQLYLQLREQKARFLDYTKYAITLLASLYTNHMVVFLVVGYTFVLLWNNSKKEVWKKWLLIHLVVLVMSIPLIPIMYAQFFSKSAGLVASLVAKKVPVFLANLGLVMFALPLLALMVLVLLGIIFKEKIRKSATYKIPDIFIVVGVLIFSVVYLYLSFRSLTLFNIPITRYPITTSYFLIRHSYFLVPLVYLYTAWRIHKFNFRVLAWFCVGMILLTNVIALSAYYTHSTKPEWKEAMGFISEHTPSAPLILLDNGGFSNEFIARYYARQEQPFIKLTWSEEGRKFRQIDEEVLSRQLAYRPDFWLVLSRNSKTDDYYKNLLDSRYQLVVSKEFYLVKVYHYRNPEVRLQK